MASKDIEELTEAIMAKLTPAQMMEIAQKNVGPMMQCLWQAMAKLRGLPVCLVFATVSERGESNLMAATPEMPREAIPSLEEWIRVWPGNAPAGIFRPEKPNPQ